MDRFIWQRYLVSHRLRVTATAVVACTLLAVGVGFFWAWSIETEKTERQILASYSQNGKFAYQALARSGSVFGRMALAESLDDFGVREVAPVYFARLLDQLVLTYDYSFSGNRAVDKLEGEVGLRMIVVAPEVWQKEFELLPPTPLSGASPLEARINVGQVLGLIGAIEQEIGISAGYHELRFLADVRVKATSGSEVLEEHFSQLLRAELREGRLSWVDAKEQSRPGTRDKWQYEHRGVFRDEARLKPSLLFAGGAADTPPSVLPEGWPLFANVVETIDMSFDYRFDVNPPLERVAHLYSITLWLENPGNWSKEFVLVPPTEVTGQPVAARFGLDLGRLHDLVERVSQEVGRGSPEGVNVTVSAAVETKGQAGGTAFTETFTQHARGSLRGASFAWAPDSLQSTSAGQQTRFETVPNQAAYLAVPPFTSLGMTGFSVHGLRAFTSAAFVIVLVGAGYLAWLYGLWLARRGTATAGQRAERRTRKKYSDLIAKVLAVPQPGPAERVVPVPSLEDLVKVAIDGSRPILQWAVNGRSAYIVIDGVTRYVYDPAEHAEMAAPGAPVSGEQPT